MADNTNPDLVDVADQAFGLGVPSQVPDFKKVPASISPINHTGAGGHRPFVVDQEILVGPAQTPVTIIDGDDPSQVKPVAQAANQAIVTGPAQTGGTNAVAGGTFSPTSPNVTNTTQNNVAGQVYGRGLPINSNP